MRIWNPPPLEELRLRTFDTYQKLAPRAPMPDSPVVILDIDEQSLSAFGQWPWPRTLVADVVTRLTQLGAAAVAFDIIFAEPDRLSPSLVAGTLAGLDDDTRQKLRGLPSNDQVLAGAMRQSRVVVGQSVVHIPDPQTQARPPTARLAMMGADPSPFIWNGPGLVQNVPELEAAAAGRGVLTIIPEADGIVRRVPLIMKAQGALVPSLTMEVLRVVTQSGAILVKTDATGVRSVGVPRLVLPTDRHGQLWVHFRRHDPQQFISVKDLLEGRVDPARIAGKGNLGSDLRFNYSVLGDPVNVASRLEGQTKYYGVTTIVGSRTAEKAKEKFATLELDLITVKGKTEPEAIYTVLGREEILQDIRFQELRKVYSAMLYSYRSKDWEGALEALRICRAGQETFGLEGLFDLYRARIEAFSEVAPPADWNGVFVAETK